MPDLPVRKGLRASPGLPDPKVLPAKQGRWVPGALPVLPDLPARKGQ